MNTALTQEIPAFQRRSWRRKARLLCCFTAACLGFIPLTGCRNLVYPGESEELRTQQVEASKLRESMTREQALTAATRNFKALEYEVEGVDGHGRKYTITSFVGGGGPVRRVENSISFQDSGMRTSISKQEKVFISSPSFNLTTVQLPSDTYETYYYDYSQMEEIVHGTAVLILRLRPQKGEVARMLNITPKGLQNYVCYPINMAEFLAAMQVLCPNARITAR